MLKLDEIFTFLLLYYKYIQQIEDPKIKNYTFLVYTLASLVSVVQADSSSNLSKFEVS